MTHLFTHIDIRFGDRGSFYCHGCQQACPGDTATTATGHRADCLTHRMPLGSSRTKLVPSRPAGTDLGLSAQPTSPAPVVAVSDGFWRAGTRGGSPPRGADRAEMAARVRGTPPDCLHERVSERNGPPGTLLSETIRATSGLFIAKKADPPALEKNGGKSSHVFEIRKVPSSERITDPRALESAAKCRSPT